MNGAHIMSIYSIFCFLLSVQCVASFLVYYTLLSTALNRVTNFPMAFPAGLCTTVLHKCYCIHFHNTLRLRSIINLILLLSMDKHLDGGLKYSLNSDVQDMTLILHSTPRVAIMDSSPNLLQLQLIKPQNLISNIEVVRNT